MLSAHASDAGRRPFPPALNREERVRIGVEWKALPLGRAKTVILRQCRMTGVIRQTESAASCECHIFNRSSPSLANKLRSLAGRCRKVHGPVEEGSPQRARSEPAREGCDTSSYCAIDVLR
jgi:hypothetical protein